jgi:uncharacterized cupredoxin-like copper-binding protein
MDTNWREGMKHIVILALVTGIAFPGMAWPHADAHKPKDKPSAIATEEHPFGRQGDPKNITRTVNIEMADTMRYTPAEIIVKRGETIRFQVTNSGKVMHEIVFGTMKTLKQHAELMRKHPGMEHDEPYMAHVAPGKSERLVWQFTKPGEFNYGCLIPGHFEAGMVGKVIVK